MARRKAVSLIIIATLLLSSCVTKYAPPTEGPVAQLRVMQTHFTIASVFTYDKDPCSPNTQKVLVNSMGGWGGPESNHRNGMPGRKDWDYQKLIERSIPAGKEFIVGVDYKFRLTSMPANVGLTGSYTETCNVGISFMPSAGKMYEAEFIIGDGVCSLPLYEVSVKPDGSVVRKPESSFKSVTTKCK